jgi:large subunit ribosomal protein L25
MINLSAKIRKELGKKVKNLRKKGILPGVLYGPKIESLSLEIDLKEFEKVYQAAGESSLISLEISQKKFLVLIHAVEIDTLSQKPIHVDFYQPKLDEEITAEILLVFEGESLAVKDLGGTLVRNIHEVEVKALPQNLPHEIKVNIEKLKTFEDNILIKDLVLPKEVKILKEPEEIVALVASPEKIEEELEKPVEEKVEEVEKVEEKKEEEKKEEPEEKSK